MFWTAPFQVNAAGNGALQLVMQEFTSGSPVIPPYSISYVNGGFLTSANAKFGHWPLNTMPITVNSPRAFAPYGFLGNDTTLTGAIRSTSTGIPGLVILVMAA
jgi:hypothetical protein